MNAPPNAASHPLPAGYDVAMPCLCIGLDITWFGGSANNPDSQHDCLVYALLPCGDGAPLVRMCPVPLHEYNRDPDAGRIFEAIKGVVEQHGTAVRVLLAIDAPLQGTHLPPGRQRARRACEKQLGDGRKAIDLTAGGANGWHPNIQPGLPLAPRVQNLLVHLTHKLGMAVWTPELAQSDRLIIECFPSEAIWAAKRQDGYPDRATGTELKKYKKQKGQGLDAEEVKRFVGSVLLNAFERSSGLPTVWPETVHALVDQMLIRGGWHSGGVYRGGKLLDDVIDSAICLATALSYAHGQAHVWHVTAKPGDGHIIGPGQF